MVVPVFLTCGPNEVLVVSGVGYGKPALVTGGRVVAFPCFQQWQRLSLNVMTITVDSPGVYTVQGVPIKVTGVAQVKVSAQPVQMLEVACEHFLNMNQNQIMRLITETLEGHQRGIMGTMTVEDIYKDRKVFNQRVFEVASKDLYTLGVNMISYTIRDVTDSLGYLTALGMARTAEVQRDARIGEANAMRDAAIKKAIADEELFAAKMANDTEKAKAERDYKVQKAAYDEEVQTRKAEADLAYELQSCKVNQKIREEKIQTLVVEKIAKIKLEEQEIQRRKNQLEATVKQPAEAEKFRLETIAAAQRQQKILEAEAQAESKQLRGEAEAFAIEAKAKAEAAQMHYKAEAWKDFGNAAVLNMYLERLPQMVNSVGSALSNTKSLKMVSTGDSAVGAQKITNEIIDITSSVPSMIKNMTGLDLLKSLQAA